MDELPEELQLHVFEYLDSVPPSELKARQEPSLDLTYSINHPLKDISLVCKRWRRIVLPLLYKHACLHLNRPSRPGRRTCSACAAQQATKPNRNGTPCAADAYHFPDGTTEKAIGMIATATHVTHVYDCSRDFVKFLQSQNITQIVCSVVVSSLRIDYSELESFPTIQSKWHYGAAAALWQLVLSVIDPKRVVILAPPTELAWLTNTAVDRSADWAFGDMEFHILELQQERADSRSLSTPLQYSQLLASQPLPTREHIFASPSVVHLRPWTDVKLNEGSFLKAYATYEYFERGPPSIIKSIKNGLNQALRAGLPKIRSFTYTAIFPFATHAYFNDMLPYLEEIDVQFAPDPESGILDDRARIGRAQLEDCWQELCSAYVDLSRNLSTFHMSTKGFPNLKRCICRDFAIEALKNELDELFIPLCLPVWAETEPGVFTRLAMSPRLPGMEA